MSLGKNSFQTFSARLHDDEKKYARGRSVGFHHFRRRIKIIASRKT